MFSCVSIFWGKTADKLVPGCGRNHTRPGPVCKSASLHTLFTRFIRAFTHNLVGDFTDVMWRVLPTINTPNNKGDMYINNLLLTGGCV
jgi:hypothetical protein